MKQAVCPCSLHIIEPGSDTALRNAFHVLRTRIWVERYGWERAITGIERDSYDTHSTFIILCTADGMIAGGCRVIDDVLGTLPISRHAFPTQALKGALEVSRLCLNFDSPLATHSRYVLLRHLVDVTCAYVRDKGHAYCYAMLRTSLLDVLRAYGLTVVPVGEPHNRGNHTFVPVRISV